MRKTAISYPFWWLSLIGHFLMPLFICNLIGIPKTEESAILYKGDDYWNYQKTTSKFFPWFPKEEN